MIINVDGVIKYKDFTITTAPMTIYLDTDTIEHLARFCVEHDKTPDTIVNLAVRKYLETLDEIYKVDT